MHITSTWNKAQLRREKKGGRVYTDENPHRLGHEYARINAVGILQYPRIGSALLGQPSITDRPKNGQGDSGLRFEFETNEPMYRSVRSGRPQ